MQTFQHWQKKCDRSMLALRIVSGCQLYLSAAAAPLCALVLSFLMMQERLLADVGIDNISSTTSAVHKDTHGVLENKRLFFTTTERHAADHSTEYQRGEFLLEPNDTKYSEEQPEQVQVIESPVRELPPTRTYQVRYHALIKSTDMIRVIINGTPCEGVQRAVLEVALDIQCNALKTGSLQLALLSDGVRLKITRGGRALGVLRPGESL